MIENYHQSLSNLATRTLVLYDGYCALCNGLVRFLIHRDSEVHLRFAPIDSPIILPLLARHRIPTTTQPETILALTHYATPQEAILTHSTAILALLAELPRPYPSIARALRLIPCPIRDLLYKIIARNRFRLHNRITTCPIPTVAERHHFP